MKRLLIIVGIVIASIIVVILIVRGISYIGATRKFNAAMEKMKAEGKYIDFRDFEIQCEDSENAALPWKEIEEMFFLFPVKTSSSEYTNKVLDGEILSQEEATQLRELILKNKQCFEKFNEVLKRPHFKYATNWEGLAWDLAIPNFTKIITFMRLHNLDAFLKAKEGRINDAIGQILSGLTFSHKLSDEPFLISYLINIAIVRDEIAFLNRIISSKKLDDETLFKVLKSLETDVWQKGLTKSIESERTFFLDSAIGLHKLKKEYIEALDYPGTFFMKLGLWLFRPVIKSDIAYAMNLYDEAVEIYKMPYYKTSELFESLDEKFLPPKLPRYYALTALLVPNFQTSFLKYSVLEAEILTARVGIACKIFRNKYGKFPEQLSQLVPDILSGVPIDPFSGKSLIYKKTPSGFIVYSVGSNGKDDGGRETRTISKIVAEKDDDWVWYEGKE